MEKRIFTVLQVFDKETSKGRLLRWELGTQCAEERSWLAGGLPPRWPAGGGGFIVACVGPEKSSVEFGLELDSFRVSRQCPFNRCSWQNGYSHKE